MKLCNLLALTLMVVSLSGCSSPPDPNDPAAVGVMQPEVLQRNLKWASDMINERVALNELSDNEGKDVLTKYANELVDSIKVEHIEKVDAWKYADVFRTAKKWDKAAEMYQISISTATNAKNEDRRVNDSLRLAQCLAELGKSNESIAMAKTTFSTPPPTKAPILYSVLYEILPALEKKTPPKELVLFLESSIAQHEQVLVDAKSDSGAAFLGAKSYHLRKAWEKAVELAAKTGEASFVEETHKKRLDSLSKRHSM